MNILLTAWLVMLITFAHADGKEEKIDVFKDLKTAKEWFDTINDWYKAMESKKPRDILEQTGNLLSKFKILLVVAEPEAGIPMDVAIFLVQQAKDAFFPKEKEKSLFEQIEPQLIQFAGDINIDVLKAKLQTINDHWDLYLQNLRNNAKNSLIESHFNAARDASMDARNFIQTQSKKEIQVRLIPLAVQLAMTELFLYRDWYMRQNEQDKITYRANLKTEIGKYRTLFQELYKNWEQWRFAKITCNFERTGPYSDDPRAEMPLNHVVTCSDDLINFNRSVHVSGYGYISELSGRVINRVNDIMYGLENKLKSDAVATIASLLGNLNGLENILPDIDEESIVPATLQQVWLGPFNAITQSGGSNHAYKVDVPYDYPTISDGNATTWDAREQIPSTEVKDLPKVVVDTVNERQTITCAGEVTMFCPDDRSGSKTRHDCLNGCQCTKDDFGYNDGIWPFSKTWGKDKKCECISTQGTCPSESVALSADQWIQGVTDVKHGQRGIDAISIVKSNEPLPEDAIHIPNFQLTEYKTSQNRCQTNSMKLKFELVDFKKELDDLRYLRASSLQ
jgi:hypothetical protein